MIIKIVKIYLGLSLVLLWAVWGQFIFRYFLDLAYISQDLQAPSYVVSTNYRVLIYCTCHFQGGSLCFSFFYLLVSSVSNFLPDARGRQQQKSRVTQSCPTLCDPMDCSPPSSSVHGILQARILEWVAMPSSRGSSQGSNLHLLSLLHWQVGSLPPLGKPFRGAVPALFENPLDPH